MNAETTIKELFVISSRDRGRYVGESNSKLANKSHDNIVGLLSRMKELPDHGEGILMSLQNHPDDSVRSWAATYLLPLHEQSAIRTLTEISTKAGLVAFSAKMTLDLWKSRKLKLVNWP